MLLEINSNIDLKALAVTYNFAPDTIELVENTLAMKIKLKGVPLQAQNQFHKICKLNGLTVKKSKGIMLVFKSNGK